jgi:hypothetical protein
LHTAVLAPGVDADDVGERLMRAVASVLKGRRAFFAEMPDDPPSAPCSRYCVSTAFARKRAFPIFIARAWRSRFFGSSCRNAAAEFTVKRV